ncbi:MAG: class I SAM-dependent methyltransferase [Bacteroidota bacterium]
MRASAVVQQLASKLYGPIDSFTYKGFYNFPFGKAPRANGDQYKKIWEEAKAKKHEDIDAYEKEIGYAIDQNWMHELALVTQIVIKKSDICYQHGRLLYSTLSKFIADNAFKSINILETGTARGFSSLCLSKALKDGNQAGKIITFDVIPNDTKMYWNCIADENGPQTRQQLLNSYKELLDEYIIFHQGDSKFELKKVSFPRIHFAFLDGAHTYKYVMHEFEIVKDKQLKGDIIFFDDYTPNIFPGIVKAVDEICEEYKYHKKVITVSNQRGYVIAQKQ